jgi:xanthine dehydrogenase YagR molybdenum-binding subunit
MIGLGVAAAFRDNLVMKSASRVRLDNRGVVTETDMTDIGAGSYTVIAQTVAEMMGVPLKRGGKARRRDVPRFLRIWWAMGRQQRKRRGLCGLRKVTRGGGAEARFTSGDAVFADGQVNESALQTSVAGLFCPTDYRASCLTRNRLDGRDQGHQAQRFSAFRLFFGP